MTEHAPAAINDTFTVAHDHTLTTTGTYTRAFWATTATADNDALTIRS